MTSSQRTTGRFECDFAFVNYSLRVRMISLTRHHASENFSFPWNRSFINRWYYSSVHWHRRCHARYHIFILCCFRCIVMNSASLNLGIETYKCKPLYSIVSGPRVILRRDWLIGITWKIAESLLELSNVGFWECKRVEFRVISETGIMYDLLFHYTFIWYQRLFGILNYYLQWPKWCGNPRKKPRSSRTAALQTRV